MIGFAFWNLVEIKNLLICALSFLKIVLCMNSWKSEKYEKIEKLFFTHFMYQFGIF